ncbi:hypothetical protein MTO96_015830 [Rhipicephalus appendiculatus]
MQNLIEHMHHCTHLARPSGAAGDRSPPAARLLERTAMHPVRWCVRAPDRSLFARGSNNKREQPGGETPTSLLDAPDSQSRKARPEMGIDRLLRPPRAPAVQTFFLRRAPICDGRLRVGSGARCVTPLKLSVLDELRHRCVHRTS